MEAVVKERPILFNGAMVRAILDGRKTQTRRVVKSQPMSDEWISPIKCEWYAPTCVDRDGDEYPGAEVYGFANEYSGWQCPYGAPGYRLWVRETWGLYSTEPSDGPDGAHVFYKAADGDRHDLRYQLWRPSIFMPRWASRITLEVTGVRVERLQDISAADIDGEGGSVFNHWMIETQSRINKTCRIRSRIAHNEDKNPNDSDICDRAEFEAFWDTINGKKHPWASNPWCWVVKFKRVD